MPKETQFKSSKIDKLKCKVTSVNPHSKSANNKGAYLVVVHFNQKNRKREFIRIKFVGTKEHELKRFINRPLFIHNVYVYENDYGVFYSCYNIEEIKYASKYDLDINIRG